MNRRLVNKTAPKVGTLEVGVDISTKNNRHNEIQLRINNTNKAYFAVNKMLSSRLLSKGMYF
ncbi:Uncharacterized protein FWK35_00022658, partial [Aphis craccivora]